MRIRIAIGEQRSWLQRLLVLLRSSTREPVQLCSQCHNPLHDSYRPNSSRCESVHLCNGRDTDGRCNVGFYQWS